MVFLCTLDLIFELTPIVWELFGYFVHSACTLRLIEGARVTLSPTWNLCEGIILSHGLCLLSLFQLAPRSRKNFRRVP
jgi:hypothetical protein